MCYIELKNEKYETLEDLKRLLHYILRLDKTAEDSQRANTITNTLAGCQPAMIPNEYLCDPSSVYHLTCFLKSGEDIKVFRSLQTPHCFLRSNRLYFATGCSISSRKNSKYLCEERLYYSLWNSCG